MLSDFHAFTAKKAVKWVSKHFDTQFTFFVLWGCVLHKTSWFYTWTCIVMYTTVVSK